jgi:RNA polymerase sigma-70 factor, ECF subfamily
MAAGAPNPVPLPSWTDLQEVSDRDLVNFCLCGNDDAFAVIVDRYQRLVFSVAVRMVKDQAEAQDIVQIVFLDIFRHLGKYDASRGTLKVWVLQYAYSRSITRRHLLERDQFYSQMELDDLQECDISIGPPAGRGLAPVETARLVEEALAELNERQRHAIDLIYFQGLKFVEAMQKSGESMAQLRHNYYRGLIKMRDLIESKRSREGVGASLAVTAAVRLEVANVKPRTV